MGVFALMQHCLEDGTSMDALLDTLFEWFPEELDKLRTMPRSRIVYNADYLSLAANYTNNIPQKLRNELENIGALTGRYDEAWESNDAHLCQQIDEALDNAKNRCHKLLAIQHSHTILSDIDARAEEVMSTFREASDHTRFPGDATILWDGEHPRSDTMDLPKPVKTVGAHYHAFDRAHDTPVIGNDEEEEVTPVWNYTEIPGTTFDFRFQFPAPSRSFDPLCQVTIGYYTIAYSKEANNFIMVPPEKWEERTLSTVNTKYSEYGTSHRLEQKEHMSSVLQRTRYSQPEGEEYAVSLPA